MKDLVHKLAAGFRAFGLKQGDVLAVKSRKNVYYYPTVFGGISAGATYVGLVINPQASKEPVDFGATHYLVDPEFVAEAVAAVKAFNGGDLSRILVFDEPEAPESFNFSGQSFASWSALLKHGTADWEPIDDAEIAKNNIVMRLATSGTTGTSKVAQISHYAAIAHTHQWCTSFKDSDIEYKALHYWGLAAITGYAFVSTAIKLGFPVYILDRNLPDILKACEVNEPTLLMIDPFTAMQLVKMLPPGSKALQSLRDIRLPAVPLPDEARKTLQAALHPDCLISRPYGLTETGTISAVLRHQRYDHDANGVGFTFPGVQIKLLDEHGDEVTGLDQPGELFVKTPAMFTDYWGQPAETAASFKDGWYVTGDIVYLSGKTQQWQIVGRKKLLFHVGGKYVQPEEIESFLASHKDIADAAVVPVVSPDQSGSISDPKIKALVASGPSKTLTEEEVVNFVKQNLPPEMQLTGGVQFVEKIPRNPGGKVMRDLLHKVAADA